MKASTPAERLNIAFRFGNSGRTSKSGRMKARYSMSATSPASGQMRISRSGSCAAKVSRQACALPICLSRLTMSRAISSPSFWRVAESGRGQAVDPERFNAGLDVLAPRGGEVFGRRRHVALVEVEPERDHADAAELDVDVRAFG